MLINHAQRAAEFQFAARVPKDTQTIMSDAQPSGSEQPSQMPSELMSIAAGMGPFLIASIDLAIAFTFISIGRFALWLIHFVF